MTPQRIEQLLQGQTNITRKVFEYVPAQEAWGASQIMRAMRQQNKTLDPRSLDYCLEALVSCGLVRRNPDLTFQRRVVVRPKPSKDEATAMQEQQPKATPAPTNPTPAVGAIEVLASFGERLRTLSESIKSLAQDLDAAALQIEEGQQQRMAQSHDELTKLRALREVLRGL